jgi:hypothetical protein
MLPPWLLLLNYLALAKKTFRQAANLFLHIRRLCWSQLQSGKKQWVAGAALPLANRVQLSGADAQLTIVGHFQHLLTLI